VGAARARERAAYVSQLLMRRPTRLYHRVGDVYRLLTDPRIAKLPRFAVALGLAYLLWPADLIPDFLVPVAGFLDDATLVWLSLRWLLRAGEAKPGATADAPRGADRPQ
jgi:uncharacterized membrane protein YkvA (DUF1232 family)